MTAGLSFGLTGFFFLFFFLFPLFRIPLTGHLEFVNLYFIFSHPFLKVRVLVCVLCHLSGFYFRLICAAGRWSDGCQLCFGFARL